MTDPTLRRHFESVDVCQSVMADFFIRLSLGQFELDTPEQLINLLARMTRNKLLNKIYHEKAQRRDVRRVAPDDIHEIGVPSGGDTPSQIVAHNELLAKFRTRLSEREQYIALQRELGRGWSDIAKELGGTADGIRIGFGRAIDRVSKELGVESLFNE